MKILLADNDPIIGAHMARVLLQARFSVDWVRDGLAAETALGIGGYTMLLQELDLPRQDGLTLLKKLRHRDNPIPVLIVTARDAVSDRVAGLNLGADDYLIKPFDLEELVARVRALIRRQPASSQMDMRLGGLRLNPIGHEVTLEGEPVSLSPREFSLLEALLETPGAVQSREALEERLYGREEKSASNVVGVHLHNLRRKLGAGWIHYVRGVGYKITLQSQCQGRT